MDPAGVLSAGDKNAEVKCGREKKLKFRTIESLPPSCSDEDKYIQKKHSIQEIFRYFFLLPFRISGAKMVADL